MSSNRRREFPASGGNNGNSKLRMDRKPNATRMSDPSHPAGRRKEIDNVMKKARQAPHDEYWDKKLLEVEEKDPNRWRHTGYKKLYGGGGNGESSGSEREAQRDKFRYNGTQRKSRSRSPAYRRSPPRMGGLRRSSPKRSPERARIRSPIRKPRSPVEIRRRSPLESMKSAQMKRPPLNYRTHATVSKRPPSPPSPKARSPSGSSGSDDSYSGASDEMRAPRSRSRSLSIARPRSYRVLAAHPKDRHPPAPAPTRVRPISSIENEKLMRKRIKVKPMMVPKDISPKRRPIPKHHREELEYAPPAKSSRQPPEPAEPAPSSKKTKEKPAEKLRTRVKIEGESRRRSPSSSDESTSSENSVPATLTATTRLTLSERFGKMAQNFSFTNRGGNMEKMQITKNSAGGDLKVLIQEGVAAAAATGSPPRKHSYSPAPQGHYPEELLSQAPTNMVSNANWEDVRVRFEYYKGKGYLRDLDLNDYIKWEEWWYRYQEWLKQERYYEMYWEKQSHMRRKRKIPIAQRLN